MASGETMPLFKYTSRGPRWFLRSLITFILFCFTVEIASNFLCPKSGKFCGLEDAFQRLFPPPTPGPIVDLGYSQYEGKALNNGVSQFLGMRYAAPPIGERRWRAPTPPLKTIGIQRARTFRPVCLSTDTRLYSSWFRVALQAEDCLFIDVFSPTGAASDSKLPVWLFIQGGGYVANSNAHYNGSTVIEESNLGIVLVQISYRVGSWGFLASDKVREDGDLNTGLLDQRQALNWVQEHIEKFGGDPDHVVIHGVSAGGGSVAMHLIANGAQDEGLFVGAIGQSPFFPTQPRVSELEWQFERFVNDVGCMGTFNVMHCLRTKDTRTLQAANAASPYPGQWANPRFYWTPAIDGDLIPDYPLKLYEQGKFMKVPTIFGTGENEGSFFAWNASSPVEVSSFFQTNYPRLTESDTSAINSQYPWMPQVPFHDAYFPSASAAYGEATFICPGIYMSKSYTSFSPASWNYRFNVQQDSYVEVGLGVPHTSEIPAIFGVGMVNDDPENSSFATYNRNIVPVMMHYWISFVKALDPNAFKGEQAPQWLPFGDEGNRVLFETNNSRMETIPREQMERCEFWGGLAVTMEQ